MKKLFLLVSMFIAVKQMQAQWNLTGNAGTGTSFLGTTNNFSLRLRTNNLNRMVIDSNGRVGIGTTAPRQLLTVQSSGTAPAASWISSGAPVFAGYGEGTAGNADFNLLMASSTAANARGVFGLKRSRGTLAVPAAVTNNDQLGSLLVSGYDGSNFQGSAAVDFFADGTPSAGNVPTRISFVTGTNGGNRTERLRIGNTGNVSVNTNQLFVQQSSGRVGIGTTTPTARLDVAGADAIINGLTIGRGASTTTVVGNVALGDIALRSNTIGFYNTAAGSAALTSNTSGYRNAAFGSWALQFNTVGSSNTGVGPFALYQNTVGNFNVAMGDNAQQNNVSGNNNTGVGSYALWKNVSGNRNTAIGNGTIAEGGSTDDNTAVGFYALRKSTGLGNTAVGSLALDSNTTGFYNMAIGYRASRNNTSGSYNIAVGNDALSTADGALNNLAIGHNALQRSTQSGNLAIGNSALYNNVNGYQNLAIGLSAMGSSESGFSNIAIGEQSLDSNINGTYNIGIGIAALRRNQGSYNIGIGESALNNNTIGFSNTTVGSFGLNSNTTGYENTGMGNSILFGNSTGYQNVAVGVRSMLNNTQGFGNTSAGVDAMAYNESGYYNTGMGQNAVGNNKTGVCNSGFGVNSLLYTLTGIHNTGLGFSALSSNASGSYNTGIGAYTDLNANNYANSTAIGYNALITGSNMVRAGDGNITSIGGIVGWTTLSDGRVKRDVQSNVPGLAFINKLQPVTYHYNLKAYESLVQRPVVKNKDGNVVTKPANDEAARNQEANTYTGFIAQDVEKAASELGYNFSGVDKPKNEKDVYGLRYAEFVVPLVKAVQELSAKNEALKTKADKVDELQKQLTDQQQQINELKALLTSPTAKPVAAINQKDISFETASLEQNNPNPPAGNFTRINYNIPTGVTRAEMMIVDNAGRKIKTISLSTFGKGVLNVDTKGLAAGTYSYSMYVDGKIIDSRQMVVVK